MASMMPQFWLATRSPTPLINPPMASQGIRPSADSRQFSMNYDKRQLSNQERMRYGWSSEHGRADLMIVQHVLASLAPSGLGVVLAPLGILFCFAVDRSWGSAAA